MNIHFIVHELYEAPGSVDKWARDRGHLVTYSKVYEGQPLPEDLSDIELLYIFGGPQQPTTSTEECPHFDAQSEIELIRQAVDQNKAVVGVCLGSQLIGEAYGAQFSQSPNKEIGVFPIVLNEEAKVDSFLYDFPESFEVGHWHGDMPGVPEHARVLASSDGCPHQIVRFDDFVYGFQCHAEFTQEVVDLLIEYGAHEFEDTDQQSFIQTPETIRSFDYTEMNQLLCKFLDRFTKAYIEVQSKH